MLKIFEKNTQIGKIAISEENNYITGLYLPNSKRPEDTVKECSLLLADTFLQLEEYLNGKRKVFDLPLLPVGTPFQQKVWQELLKIPYGETVSYKEIAIRIGKPNAQRAVGMANNKNPIAIFIPCHRVISKTANFTGYQGGLKIKELLLNLESQHNSH